jgi:hypothetical protein
MFSKLAAYWLVVLIVIPFTAPFSVADLRHVHGSQAQHGTPHPAQQAFSASVPDTQAPAVLRIGRSHVIRHVIVPVSRDGAASPALVSIAVRASAVSPPADRSPIAPPALRI